MLRIFLTTSHLSSLFMALYAKRTYSPGYTDILIVESHKMKQSLLKLIHDSAEIHPWSKIHDFVNQVSDTEDMKPTLRKTLTRKLKTKPGIKLVYDGLLDLYLRKKNNKLQDQLKALLKKDLSRSGPVELNMLTQTTLNPVLLSIFPSAKVRYFEHGLGDYYYIQEPVHKGEFHCIFNEPFKKLLAEKNIKNDHVFPSANPEEFEKTSIEIINSHAAKQDINSLKEHSPCVLILMEAVEMYNVNKTFWEEYIKKCIGQIPDPKKYTYLLKPHPIQSKESIRITKLFFEKNNLKYKLLDHATLPGMSIEVLFPLWKDQVQHVFALFSSSVFYLSVLYPYPHIKYYYSYDFMAKHSGNAPEQYKKHFAGLKELIEKVFSIRCEKFGDN